MSSGGQHESSNIALLKDTCLDHYWLGQTMRCHQESLAALKARCFGERKGYAPSQTQAAYEWWMLRNHIGRYVAAVGRAYLLCLWEQSTVFLSLSNSISKVNFYGLAGILCVFIMCVCKWDSLLLFILFYF